MPTKLAHLRKFIVNHYSNEDLNNLCFDMGVNFDDLGGERISSKSRELLLWVGKHDQFETLLKELSQAREKPFSEAGFSTDETFIDILKSEYPRFTDGESRQTRTDRFELKLLNEVRHRLVEQKLESGLTGKEIINPHKEYWPDEVLDPWADIVVERKVSEKIADDQTIIDIFRESGGSMLILGAKGAGKTTMELLLARWLVDKADDPAEPLPVFLFLKSWKTGLSIHDWLLVEMSEKYGIPPQVVRGWLSDVENGRLVFLLDGLDKVENDRKECVLALNEFIQQYQFRMSITSRAEDYQQLRPEKLRLNKAVFIKPFSGEQVESYWDLVGSKAEEVRLQTKENKVLQQFTSQPLWLSYMTQLSGSLPVEEREIYMERILLRLNVEDKLAQKGRKDGYLLERSKRFLAWLGYQMVHNSREEVFLIEKIQPTWLPSIFQRKVFDILVSLVIVLLIALSVFGLGAEMTQPKYDILNPAARNLFLKTVVLGISLLAGLLILLIVRGEFGRRTTAIFGLIGGLSAAILVASVTTNIAEAILMPSDFSRLMVGTDWTNTIFAFLLFVPVFSLLFWLIGRVKPGDQDDEIIKPAEVIQWSTKRAAYGLLVGAATGASLGLLLQFGTLASWAAYGSPLPAELTLIDRVLYETPFFIFFGRVGWLAIGLLFSVLLGFSGHERALEKELAPNQGIWQSGANALRIGLLAALALGLPFSWSTSLAWGVYTGLLGGSVAALLLGGFAFLQHFVLRLILALNGVIPWRYVQFLDYVVESGLMFRSFGGYSFDHQELKEYFCWLEENDYS